VREEDVHRRLMVLAAAAILALGACGDSGDESNEAANKESETVETEGGGEGFPQTVVDNYMRGCTSGGQATEEYCECSLDELEKTVSLEEFIELEETFTASGDLPQELQDAVTACVDKL
jgi:hypothetical protein